MQPPAFDLMGDEGCDAHVERRQAIALLQVDLWQPLSHCVQLVYPNY